MANIEIQGLDALLKKLDPSRTKKFAEDAVQILSNRADNKLAELIDERVYQRPESPYYDRTTAAKRGHQNIKKGSLSREIKWGSKLGGAGREYTPYLNRNSRIKKNNTKFFDDGVKWTKKEASKVMKELSSKIFK